MRRNIGQIFIAIALVIVVSLIYANSTFSRKTQTYSSYTFLDSSWEKYKSRFINEDGRVIDHSLGDVTTSEGQSYAMLRAVWIDDKDTFDSVWKWTRETLRHTDDALFGWRWGKRIDGEYGFMENGGENSASDADQDIALALILADRRWIDSGYTDDAREILEDLWEQETDIVGSNRYLLAGSWAKSDGQIVVNPSYFAPYAWRIFAETDSERDWESMVDPAYALLTEVSSSPLDASMSAGLPPDWVVVDKNTGAVSAPSLEGLTTHYSYDAIRVPWRIALDYQWNGAQQAKDYLDSLIFLSERFLQDGKLASSYTHDGSVIAVEEGPTMYATAMGHFIYVNRELADKVYQEKILELYSNDTNSLKEEIPYYEQNWLWFGAALYNGSLSDFSEDI